MSYTLDNGGPLPDERAAISREIFCGSHREAMRLVDLALDFRETRIEDLERELEIANLAIEEHNRSLRSLVDRAFSR